MSGKHSNAYMAAYMRGYRRRKSAELAAYRAAHRERNRDVLRTYERERARRRRRERAAIAAIPPGKSRALDALRTQLKEARGAERERIEGAIVHLERVLSGERVQPRNFDAVKLRPSRGVHPNRHPSVASVSDAAKEAAADAAERMKPTGRVRCSWMDEKLPPE